MLMLGGLLALGMGVVLGLLGGGGSILAVPILLGVFGLPAKQAIATSLLVVGTTSLAAALRHARAGHVRWSTGISFAAFAMLGAYAGGRAAAWVPPALLLGFFAAMMIATSVMMLRGGREAAEVSAAPRPALLKIAVLGAVVGSVTGLIGAGGGFVIVPALVLLAGLSMRDAIGTSLLVISLNSVAGLLGYLSHVAIDPAIAVTVTGAAVVGALIGATVAPRVAAARLRRAFAWLVLATGTIMAGRQLFALDGVSPAALRAAAAVLAALAVLVAVRVLRRRPASEATGQALV